MKLITSALIIYVASRINIDFFLYLFLLSRKFNLMILSNLPALLYLQGRRRPHACLPRVELLSQYWKSARRLAVGNHQVLTTRIMVRMTLRILTAECAGEWQNRIDLDSVISE